jgi:site-specific DNA-methyltransferase (adenine-specific)
MSITQIIWNHTGILIMINLMQGDCLERMKEIPDGSVDMILTDPPYGMDFQSNYRNQKYNKIKNDKDLSWLNVWTNELFRVAADNTAHYVFCSFHNIDKFKQALEQKFKIKNMLVWEKNNTSMGDLKGDFAPKYEMIIFIQKGRRLINGKRDPNILKFNRTGNKLHPTQKPVDLLQYLLEKFSDKGQIILDPFMGSGSTGVAAKNLNRNFIGIELDETYFNIARDRINNDY